MEKLKREDKDKISQILHDNWDLIFELLMGSFTDEYGVPYREVYKWELPDRERDLIEIIDTYLESDAFFIESSLRDWIVKEIIGILLGHIECKIIQISRCANQLYKILLPIIRPYYYIDLFPCKKKLDHCKIKIIETNISMKDGQICDHQSRVIEADSWDEYIKNIRRI